MGGLKVLPAQIANMIAAGEVVQRPASVVKELMENAVDAGATQISVIVTDAGRTLIQVIDNGCGMSPADAVLCFERHATSKIATAEDLGEIMTYGFRGEALASIAAFVTVEGAIYGFGSWIISYYVHWPLVCAAFMLIRIFVSPQRRVLLRVVPTAAALILTLGFSALTSVVDVGILGGATNAGFFERFTIYYARGIPFYVAQLVTNAVLFPLIFPIIAKALIKAKTRFVCT